MTEINAWSTRKRDLGESDLLGRRGPVPVVDRHLCEGDPSLRSGDRRGHDVTAPRYLGCLAVRKRGGLVALHGERLPFLRSRHRNVRADRRSRGRHCRTRGSTTARPTARVDSGRARCSRRRAVRSSGSGALYRLDTDLSCHRVVTGIGCSNGLAWSPDSRTMYFTDSHTPIVWAYEFDPASGDVANRRVFCDLSFMDGIVDGATVDAEGCYWLTVPFKGKVMRYDPNGQADADDRACRSTFRHAASSAARTSTSCT